MNLTQEEVNAVVQVGRFQRISTRDLQLVRDALLHAESLGEKCSGDPAMALGEVFQGIAYACAHTDRRIRNSFEQVPLGLKSRPEGTMTYEERLRAQASLYGRQRETIRVIDLAMAFEAELMPVGIATCSILQELGSLMYALSTLWRTP